MQNDKQYTKQESPTTVRIYPGADGECYIYEDSGDGYEYNNEEYARVKICWDDTKKELTFGKKNGLMPYQNSFQIEAVSKGSVSRIGELDYFGELLTHRIL